MLQEITQSSLIEDGSKRGPWSPVIKSFAVKTCVVCRSEFRPSRKESCNQWAKRLFCSGACSGEARRKPKQAKERQDPWKGGRELIARKTCVVCGAIFRPRAGAPECEWEKRATCSKGCAPAAIRNPMKQKEVREKVSEALRAIGHRPPVRGGNGKPLTGPQVALLDILGAEWEAEHVVPVGRPRRQGWPTNYKIDLANKDLMIAIEVDGSSHSAIDRRKADARKDNFLKSCGWNVYRVTNAQALLMSTTCKSADILLTTLAAY